MSDELLWRSEDGFVTLEKISADEYRLKVDRSGTVAVSDVISRDELARLGDEIAVELYAT